MIASLRSRHRLMFGALAITVGPLLFAALTSRSAPPTQNLPTVESSSSASGEPLETLSPFDGSFEATEVDLYDGGLTVRLGADLRSPDVLAYWTPGSTAPQIESSLPDDAKLLGAVSAAVDNVFALPDGSAGQDGHLVFYSLGHQKVVAAGSLSLASLPVPNPAGDGLETEEDETEEDDTENPTEANPTEEAETGGEA